MTKQTEALKELLEIVEHAIIVGDWKVDGSCDPEMIINACEEALEQPEQEPSKLEIAGFELDNVIADMKLSGEFDCVSYDTVVSVRKTIADYVAWQGNKEFVGLSEYDILSIDGLDCVDETYLVNFARAVEQALKDKNT